MKVGVDDFIVIRVMKNNNSSVNPEMFHSKSMGQIPVILSKVKTTASGKKFQFWLYNSGKSIRCLYLMKEIASQFKI